MARLGPARSQAWTLTVYLLCAFSCVWTNCFIPVASAANSTSAGLAWPNQLWVPMSGFISPSTAISSYYTWTAEPVIPPPSMSSTYPVPFQFIPMLWGCNQSHIDAFNAALSSTFRSVDLTPQREIMGFNEPDLASQADCSPETAAAVWKVVLEPLRSRGYRVGSPAVSGGPSGKDRMNRWLSACDGGCHPDFVALHWYDIDPRDFIVHCQDFHETFKKPIWVTEYAVQNFTYDTSTNSFVGKQATLAQIQLFMDVTRSWMESVDWVERYFWFGAMYEMQGVNELNTLFLESGKKHRTGALNALGVQYAGANGSLSGQNPASSGGLRVSWSWTVVQVVTMELCVVSLGCVLLNV